MIDTLVVTITQAELQEAVSYYAGKYIEARLEIEMRKHFTAGARIAIECSKDKDTGVMTFRLTPMPEPGEITH